MKDGIKSLLQKQKPLIHCITNPISIHQCANGILAVGGRPVMAEHPGEVGEITAQSQALLLNVGNITDVRMESMAISASVANKQNIPIVLDGVGVACSALRRQFVHKLVKEHNITIVKGNGSEIEALCHPDYVSIGVDSDGSLPFDRVQTSAVCLAKQWNCVVMVSGACDIVTDGNQLVFIKNGHPQLSAITGTGCLLGALAATCAAVLFPVEASVTACGMLGICGELAATEQGNGSFSLRLLDALSTVTDGEIQNFLKMEGKPIETI